MGIVGSYPLPMLLQPNQLARDTISVV